MRRALLILPLLIFLVLAGFFLSSLMSKEAGVTELELPSPLLDKPFPSFDLRLCWMTRRGSPRLTSRGRRWSTFGQHGVWPAVSSIRCSTVWRLKAW